MPDRRSIFRLLALAGFLLTVALALWLAEVRPLLVVVVMAAALLVVWTVEWLSWRQDVVRLAAQGAEAAEIVMRLVPPAPGAPTPEPAGAEIDTTPASTSVASVEDAAAEEVAPEPPPREAPSEPLETPLAESPSEPEETAEPHVPVATPLEPEPERPPLRPVPPPPPVPRPPERKVTSRAPARPAASSTGVVDLRTRVTAQPRRWNLWDLERRARDEAQHDPIRYEEWSFLFVHLRQFATPDGSLPTEFDALVRESFGELLEHAG